MENVQNKHVSEIESSFPMKLIDEGKDYRIDNDVMTRRLKNRERQRRYRARKRLEEEIKKKGSTVKQPAQTGAYFQPNGIVNNPLTRVHCSRNWKKEARSVNVSKGLEGSCNSSNIASARSSTSETQMQCIPSNLEPQFETQSHSEPPTEQLISETANKVLSRRNWKADARNKKN